MLDYQEYVFINLQCTTVINNHVFQQCNATIENLKSQMKELETKDKDKTFEIEQLKNKIHQYTNREGTLSDC